MNSMCRTINLKRVWKGKKKFLKSLIQLATIGQRLRGPSGRKLAPSRKADFVYPGKDNTGKVQSQSKVQSEDKVQSKGQSSVQGQSTVQG
jgi:hypothetical protein